MVNSGRPLKGIPIRARGFNPSAKHASTKLRCRRQYRMGFAALADLIGLLANPSKSCCDNVPPLGPTPV